MDDKIRQYFEENFREAVIREDVFRGQLSLYIRKEFLIEICLDLKVHDEFRFQMLSDICSLDWLGQPEEAEGRFEVIYNLYSLKQRYRLLLKVRLPGDSPEIDSLTSLWHTANWLEREVFDLMGISFTGHPDQKKIVTPDDLDGHPLRKDFPLTYEVPQFNWNKSDPPEVIK